MKVARLLSIENATNDEEFVKLPMADHLFSMNNKSDVEKSIAPFIINQNFHEKKKFSITVTDNGMKGVGIEEGDHVIIEEKEQYYEGEILAFQLGQKTLVRRLLTSEGRIRLDCAPVTNHTIIVELNTPGFKILGKVKQIIKEIL
jgi:SOS-response transcriptional repressor LexA